jgi:hypothetical protein
MVLIHVSPVANDAEYEQGAHWLFVQLCQRNIYLHPLLIFKLGYSSLYILDMSSLSNILLATLFSLYWLLFYPLCSLEHKSGLCCCFL